MRVRNSASVTAHVTRHQSDRRCTLHATRVESYLRSGVEGATGSETWMTPEEVATYLRVHVQTVRAWIREGRLPARRVVGMRSLRVLASDAARMLRPLDEAD